MDINRDALLLYLRDLRDLEMAKYHIKNMIAREEANYQKTDAELQKTNYWEARQEKEVTPDYRGTDVSDGGGLIMIGILPLIGSLFGIYMGMTIGDGIINELLGGIIIFFCGSAALICGVIVIGGVVYIVRGSLHESRYNEYIAKKNAEIRARNQDLENRVRQHNAEEQVRQNQNAQRRVQLRQKWNERKTFLENEKRKVEGILKKGYEENILAAPYRNLQSVYYIYEYMSTSRESFEDTLMHAHMESGFQRILARLDEIVENQAMQLFSLRRMEAQNREQIEQNYSMLDSLDRMDRNNRASFSQMNSTLGGIRDNTYQTSQYAKQASQYAGIAATYSAANAYFSLANYLKD